MQQVFVFRAATGWWGRKLRAEGWKGILSAYSIPDEAKRQQELNSFRKLHDTFQKIIVVGDDIASYRDEQGYLYIGLYDFLLHWHVE